MSKFNARPVSLWFVYFGSFLSFILIDAFLMLLGSIVDEFLVESGILENIFQLDGKHFLPFANHVREWGSRTVEAYKYEEQSTNLYLEEFRMEMENNMSVYFKEELLVKNEHRMTTGGNLGEIDRSVIKIEKELASVERCFAIESRDLIAVA